MPYGFVHGKSNVHYLYAPYSLLVKAFGDGDPAEETDEEKVQAQWSFGDAEVYDYRSTVPKELVTEWHVQGSKTGIERMLTLIEKASNNTLKESTC